MIYGACFVFSIVILFLFMTINQKINVNMMLLLVVTVIGDAGYFALWSSKTLEAAILANKLTYAIGIFSPMLFLICMCDICKIQIKNCLKVVMYIVQIILFLCVCTIGSSDIFYKSVAIHSMAGGSYITKEYGPVHAVFIFMTVVYLAAGIVVAAFSIKRKHQVSSLSMDNIIVITILIAGCYLLERSISLTLELMPFVYTIGMVGVLYSQHKMSRFSISDNQDVIGSSIQKKIGYIVISKKLRFMNCNEHAETFFPELLDWEIEKDIPGDGGRFNTFLRQPFMKYVKEGKDETQNGKNITIQGRKIHYTMRFLHYGRRHIGYVIELMDMTDYLDQPVLDESEAED